VRDYVVSNIQDKETPFTMWKTLTELFENNNDHRKLNLKEKLRNIRMHKNDSIPQCFSRSTQVLDELGGDGVNVVEYDLVKLSLLGLPNS